MDSTLTYTIKSGDGFLTIARYIFSKSPRSYIQSLVKRYDLMKKVADIIESDLKSEYIGFKLAVNQKISIHSDPGYYIPSLSAIAGHSSLIQQAKKKATTAARDDSYFVIHCTAGEIQDKDVDRYKSIKKTGAGHSYIKKSGDVVQIWPYDSPKGWATRAEWKENKPELRGKLVNIELVYGVKDKPTEAQYQALADVYLDSKKVFNKWLPIAAHREIDRGIKGGHRDPIGFKFDYFYSILKEKGVPTDKISKQSQIRFDFEPWCEHKWVWPPVLSATRPEKIPKNQLAAKGCE